MDFISTHFPVLHLPAYKIPAPLPPAYHHHIQKYQYDRRVTAEDGSSWWQRRVATDSGSGGSSSRITAAVSCNIIKQLCTMSSHNMDRKKTAICQIMSTDSTLDQSDMYIFYHSFKPVVHKLSNVDVMRALMCCVHFYTKIAHFRQEQ